MAKLKETLTSFGAGVISLFIGFKVMEQIMLPIARYEGAHINTLDDFLLMGVAALVTGILMALSPRMAKHG